MVAYRRRRRTRSTRSLLGRYRPLIRRITRAHGATDVRVFGSVARGDERPGSDVDLLVSMPRDYSLLDVAGLQGELEDALGRKVDLVPDDCVKPALRSRILAEARPL